MKSNQTALPVTRHNNRPGRRNTQDRHRDHNAPLDPGGRSGLFRDSVGRSYACYFSSAFPGLAVDPVRFALRRAEPEPVKNVLGRGEVAQRLVAAGTDYLRLVEGRPVLHSHKHL